MIQEIPLDSETISEPILNSEEILPEILPEIAEIIPEIQDIMKESAVIVEIPKKAKAKGRPKGATNKPKPKKVTISEVETEPVPQEADIGVYQKKYEAYEVNDVAVEMLRMLSNQTQAKKQRKTELYKSWFN